MNAPALHMLRGRLRHGEPMSRHTTWRTGGAAELYYRPADQADLLAFLATLAPGTALTWVGLGSNLLVRDGGLPGAVLVTVKALTELEVGSDGRVHAQAGVPCAQLAQQCARAGLAGAEFLAGIPGTVGGALAMNAGAHGSETWTLVQEVTTVDRAGDVHTRTPQEFTVGYRSVRGPHEEWFLGAQLRLGMDAPEAIAQRMHAVLRRRAATQPLRQPNAGSVFRNPPGDYAARLIEAAGLKGLTVGGAQVSTVHANFIVNLGAASAADIETLIETVRARVLAHSGVALVSEVRIVGEAA